ncbi:MAG: 30S ribosomal protein S21 [Chthoniobacterales bacterium]
MTARSADPYDFNVSGDTEKGCELIMPEVIVRKGESIDRAIKRLKSKLDSEGIMDEVRRLRAFETPTQKTRRKAKANAKRAKMKIRYNLS